MRSTPSVPTNTRMFFEQSITNYDMNVSVVAEYMVIQTVTDVMSSQHLGIYLLNEFKKAMSQKDSLYLSTKDVLGVKVKFPGSCKCLGQKQLRATYLKLN